MNKLFALALAAILAIALISCSEDSTSSDESYDDHPLNGNWDVVTTFTDTDGDKDPVESATSVNTFEIEGNKLTWTILVGEEGELETEWIFEADGDEFEFRNKYKSDNFYTGVMLNDDAFSITWGDFAIENLEISMPGYDRAVTDGERVE